MASSSGSEQDDRLRRNRGALLHWVRKRRTQAELVCSEWHDRCSELHDTVKARCRRWSEARPADQASRLANARLERLQEGWRGANRSFDAWFNDSWARARARLWGEGQHLARLLRPRTSRTSAGPPADTAAMVLLGTGVGSALQGCPKAGAALAAWGLARVALRFVVQRVDADDAAGLFRWAPAWLRREQGELFARLKREVHVARALRAGDPQYTQASFRSRPDGAAMDSRHDHTPESLFGDAMASVAAHPRVRELLGPGVRAVAEPDKVVYRIHEDIAEVYLGWQVAGSAGSAEVQVKSTACIVDFIYVFPQTADRYGFRRPGFVIRPQGNWSLDCSELPRDMKQPFGGSHEGKLFRNREGVFEYDYEVRDFRHGYEDHPRKHRQPWW